MMAGVMLEPAAVAVGCVAKTSCVATAAVMLKALLVPLPAPPVAVSL